MLDFEPYQYVNMDGDITWQPSLPDGTRLYYDRKGNMVVTSPDYADSSGYTPAVTWNHRHAIRSAKIAYKDRQKAERERNRQKPWE